jgi:hypothetical protein
MQTGAYQLSSRLGYNGVQGRRTGEVIYLTCLAVYRSDTFITQRKSVYIWKKYTVAFQINVVLGTLICIIYVYMLEIWL